MYLINSLLIIVLEEAIDGEALLELNETELREVGKKIGVVKRLGKIQEKALMRHDMNMH